METKIKRAELRLATAEEKEEQRGKKTSLPWWRRIKENIILFFTRLYYTFYLWRDTLLLGRLFAKKSSCDQVLAEVPTFFADFYAFSNPVINDAILAFHRNDSIYRMKSGKEKNYLLQEFYPEITNNDMILTCEQEASHSYRSFLAEFFQLRNIRPHHESIESLAQQTIDSWAALTANGRASQERLDYFAVGDHAAAYAGGVMANLFLGYRGDMGEIIDSMKLFRRRVSDHWTGQRSVDSSSLRVAQDIMDSAVGSAMSIPVGEFPTLIQEMMRTTVSDGSRRFTDNQVKTMALSLFFAGQDTSATSITHLLFRLAQDQGSQDRVRDEVSLGLSEGKGLFEAARSSATLKQHMAECLRVIPPAWAVGRVLGDDAILTLWNEKDHIIESRFLSKGSYLSSAFFLAARDNDLFGPDNQKYRPDRHDSEKLSDFLPGLPWRPFGWGAHRCPGWSLFYTEAFILIALLLSRYRVETSNVGEPKQDLGFTNSIAEDVYLRLIPL